MNKEVQVIRQKVNKALQLSNELVISNDLELTNGIDLLKRIKITGKIIKTQKEKITKPLLQALKEARAMFKPIEDSYAEAEKIVKQKILIYNQQQAEKEKELAKKIEKGETTIDEVVQELKETPKEGMIGKISTRTIKEVMIENENKIPRKYLVPNMSLIRQDALKGVKIDGVVVRDKKVIVSQ